VLVVIATLAALSAIVAVSLARTKPAGEGIQCLTNTRRLVVAWQMYALDNGDRLITVLQGGSAAGGNFDRVLGPGWVEGWLDWTTSTDNTNYNFLMNPKYAKIAPYVSLAPNTFKCPTDWLVSPAQKGLGWTKRVRSYSIDVTLGEGNALAGPWDVAYAQITKMSSLKFPGPAQTWVFLDEDADTINDPCFYSPHPTDWVDLPAKYHNRATALSFADGHAELHRWGSSQTNNIHWMSSRAQRRTSASY
jgi:hypothetical protein